MAKKNVLRKVMLGVICVSMVMFGACTDEFKEAVADFFGWSRTLKHDIDNQATKAVDFMNANLKFTENENETNIPSSPAMETSISLKKSEITVDANQIGDKYNLAADSVKYDGKKWSSLSATDNSVLYWYLPGGQVITVPVNISALRAQYKGKNYYYGTDSLIHATLAVKYIPKSTTRSTSSEQYNAVYEANLTFKEVNAKDSVFTVKLMANATAQVKKDEPSDTTIIKNEHWVYVNDSTYTWDFDIIKVIDGDSTKTHTSIPANFRIKGIPPYEKIVKTFNYMFDASNGWNKGTGERKVASTMDYVTIYEKAEDHYGATILNSDDNDKIVTDYTAVMQRVIYDDGVVRSEATYPEVTANEASTFVKTLAESSKEGYNAAILTNSVDFTVLDHVQQISEQVYLYVQKHIIIKKEIVDAKLTVYDDYVEASLTYREIYSDGDVNEYKEKRSFARVRKVLSDWMSTEQYYSVMTDAAKIELISSEAKEDGYWSWVNETRDITTDAHLYASTQTNRWREMVANKIVYTREGISHEFGTIEYVATESGQKVNMVKADEYAYSDSISIAFGKDNVVGMTAPGLIKVTGKEVKGHENRNKNIEVKPDSVIATVDHVTMYMDGTEDIDHVRKSFPRTRTEGPSWQSYENNGSESTSDVSVNLSATEMIVEGEWSCTMQTRSLSTTATLSSSTQKNTWTSKDPNNIKFTRNGITCEFETIAFSATKNSSSSTLSGSTLTEDTYAYSVGITETYGNDSEILGGNGTITVKKGKTIIGHHIRNAKLTVSDTRVDASLTFVELWSDGTETSYDDRISADRSLIATSDWSANSDYVNALTGAAVVNLNSTSDVAYGYWKYVNQTRTITTPVTLSGSTQTNSWTSVDPNSFVYERDGEVYKFDEIKYNANEQGSAVGSIISETAEACTYAYTGGIKVTYGDNTKSSTAPGKLTVKKVVEYSIKNAKLTINDNDVLAELDFVTTTDGKDQTEHYAKSFPKSLVCNSNWSSKETSLSVLTGSANVSLTSSENISDGDWKYVRENRNITTTVSLANSNQTNSWTSIVPNKIVFSKNGVSHDFGEISFTATEAGQNYKMVSESANVATYDYTDKLDVTYGSNTVSSVAPGKIIVEYSVSGNEIRDQKLEVSDTGVTASLTWVTKYSNGYEKTESVSHFFALSIAKLTNWASTEANANSTTGAASVNLESSTNEQDGNWSNVREVRKVNTFATLAGSQQENALRANMPNNIVFSRDGKTYDFGTLNFDANEAGQNVSKTSEDEFATVYGYSDNININFGGRNFANTLNGQITVEKPWTPDVPASYGKFKNAICTATPNENRSSWYYVLSLHFENGTMPLKIGIGDTSINLYEAKYMFTTNTNDAINSLVWTGSQWVNAIAVDDPDSGAMVWYDENGSRKRNLDYVTATAIAWNDGNNSVLSNAVTYSVSNNILFVSKRGSIIGMIRLNK